MELLCPCGKGQLLRAITKNGLNKNRPYYKCPGSRYGAVDDCKFYSFEDELQQCPCGRGLYRTKFKRKEKFWCCPVQGDGACEFWMHITTTTNGYGQPSTSAESSTTNNLRHVIVSFKGSTKCLHSVWRCLNQALGPILTLSKISLMLVLGRRAVEESKRFSVMF